MIRIPNELIQDSAFDVSALILEATDRSPEAMARREAYAAKLAALRKAGLLDVHNNRIKVSDCPACTYLGEDDSIRCELKRGHRGEHRYLVTW